MARARKKPMNVSISSDPQPGNVVVWERSGHHGDETDCIICSVAVWHKELRDGGMDRQAGSRIRHVVLWRQRQSLPSMMSFDMLCACDCVGTRIPSYASLPTHILKTDVPSSVLKLYATFFTLK